MTCDTEPRVPDLRGPAIVCIGHLLGGFEFHGPFETIDAALAYDIAAVEIFGQFAWLNFPAS